MKRFFKLTFFFLFLVPKVFGQAPDLSLLNRDTVVGCVPTHLHNLLLWYNAPAKTWIEALPIGNGRFGAMVFDQPRKDRLQLNDITVWSGDPQPGADRKDAYKYLDTIRKTIAKGNYKAGEELTARYMTSSAPYKSSYQTLGDVEMQFNLPNEKITNYNRWLDIEKAVSGVSFTLNGCNYTREIFSSAPDQVIAEKLTASLSGHLSFEVSISRIERATTKIMGSNRLIMTGNTGNTLDYEVQLMVLNKGGKVAIKNNKIIVSNADSATILLSASTSYVLDYLKGFRGTPPHILAERRIIAASRQTYERLRAKHIDDYRRYFSRVTLNLPAGESMRLPTDLRLKSYGNGDADPAFAALFYQYGRYLLISSSRPDNPLPANAQGIWGDGLDLPWKCDYKSNINFQMNYWPAEIANLGELQLPMIRMIQALVPPGEKTARNYYGPNTPGWCLGYTTNGWCWTSPGAALPWGVFNGGSGWTCQTLWKHFLYNQDLQYLRSVYPTLKGAAEFYLATMVRDKKGFLITSPSTSPENHFITNDGVKSNVTQGATMEKSIIWDLFDNVSRACEILKVDLEFRKKLIQAKGEISPLAVGKGGQLMEWNEDWDLNSDDMEHRHVSHLFAFFPGHQIDVFKTPDLAAAVRKSLLLRGDDGTGWSIAWKENLWAKLRDGNHAHQLLSYQLRYTQQTKTIMADAGGTYPNLFDAHPPFQIDGNFGAVSAISQMLLQTDDEATPTLDILPALPSSWQKGSVSGLCTPGGFEVSMSWQKGKLQRLVLKSKRGGLCRIRTNLPLKPTNTLKTSAKDDTGFIITIATAKNASYEMSTL